MDCLECAKRATCRKVCADLEAQLPSMDQGRVTPEKAHSVRQKAREIELIFERSGRLTPRERCVLYLFFRTDLATADIAAALRITRDTVYSTVHRSIRKLSGAAADRRLIQRGRRKRAA